MKILSLLLLFSFCASAVLTVQATTNEIRSVEIREVLANRKEFKGKRIKVEGFFKSATEQRAVYESKEDAQAVRDDRSLWVDEAKPGCEDKVRWVRQGRVRLIGTFDYNPKLGSGHLGIWPGRIRDVELFEEIR